MNPQGTNSSKDEFRSTFWKDNWKIVVVVCLPAVLIPVPIYLGAEGKGLYVLLVMSVYWITEAVPLGVTSLLPLVLGPALGILESKKIALNYSEDSTILLTGGLVAGLCIERWNLHKRIALRVLLSCGTSTRWLMLGIMLPCWFLSMWISNTATAAMMVPIVAAIVDQLHGHGEREEYPADDSDAALAVEHDGIEEIQNDEDESTSNDYRVKPDDDEVRTTGENNMRKAMLLSVAYASTCGGISTLTGTGPNTLFKGTVDRLYGDASGITFGSWMLFALPLSVLSLLTCWLWMHAYFFGFRSTFCGSSGQKSTERYLTKYLRGEYDKMGPISYQEKVSLTLFTVLVVLWLTRDSEVFPGWKYLIADGSFVGDSTAAMFVVLLMLIFPAHIPKFRGSTKYAPMLEWDYLAKHFPWHIFFLFGGGFALADICVNTGVTSLIVGQLSALEGIPGFGIIFIISLLVSAVTEVTSNTAIASLVLPITADLANELGLHPMYLLVAVTISCSFSFMLPSATPPNAVVFSHGGVTVLDMIKAGVMLNVICLLLLQLAMSTWAVPIFKLNTDPGWLQLQAVNATNVTTASW